MGVQETNNEFYRLIIRHLSGEISREEAALFQQLLEKDPEKRVILKEYSTIWDKVGSAGEKQAYDLDQEWELLKSNMSLPEESGDRTDLQMKPFPPARSFLFYSYRIAAILIAGVIFAFAWLYVSRMASTETILAGNEPVEVLLEDGTSVTLNRDSRLKVPKKFTTSDRRVLLRGEAWFDVTPDSLRPFRVVAGDALVEVLGTRFNVSAYKDESTVEVTVKSGMVAFTDKQRQLKEIVLRAGNGGTFDTRNQELTLIKAADPNRLSWKTRELYFEETPLDEAVEIINEVYHTGIAIANPELASCTITVTFNNQSFEAVLKVLELTLDLEIERTGNNITLHGTGCVE
jgi:ferric-dicitrate binding protein FerR (iron transport regulator)